MHKILISTIIFVLMLNAETLFEVRDTSNNKVLDVSTDGLRILNQGDTLMVISPSGVKVNLDNSSGKALSRTFAVTTTASKGFTNAFEVSIDSTKIGTGSTTMGLGTGKYTDFSPENIFLGLNAGKTESPGNGNVFVGNDAGRSAANSLFSTFIGAYAGYSTIGGFRNTFVGYGSGFTNYDGYSNSFFGDYAGYYNYTGYYNSLFGKESSYNNTIGHSNSSFGFGAGYGATGAEYYYNCIFGAHAGRLLSTGSSNVMMGYYTGYKTTSGANNVYIGEKSGYNSQTGTGNIFLGYNAGYSETGSNRLYIDNGNTTFPLIYGKFDASRMVVIDGNSADNPNNRKLFVYGSAGGTTAWYNDSDKRLKKNIKTIGSASDKVMKLRGVSFDWDGGERYQKGSSIGFIAQEAIEVVPELVDHNKENDSYGMQYAPITALLVEAFKEQKNENDELKKKVLDQEQRIRKLEEALNKLIKK